MKVSLSAVRSISCCWVSGVSWFHWIGVQPGLCMRSLMASQTMSVCWEVVGGALTVVRIFDRVRVYYFWQCARQSHHDSCAALCVQTPYFVNVFL